MSHLIVLGGGPGGYIAAFEAAAQAKRAGIELDVTLIEKHRLGGTCLNVGCIPTKTILKTAHALADIARAEEFAITGLEAAQPRLDLDALRTRKDKVVDELVSQIEQSAKRLKIKVVEGTGTLKSTSPNIEVAINSDDETNNGEHNVLTADYLIVATGSVPTVLPALDYPFVWTSDDAIALTEIPESIIIVGGGVIGVEFAHAYAKFGSKVTVVELAKSLLPWFDKRVGRTLTRDLQAQGIEMILGNSVESVTQASDGTVAAQLADGREITADVIMSAVGRVPNTKDIGLEEAGLDFNRHALKVNQHYQTNNPNIYAIGDVIGGLMLAHEAEHEGALAARHIVAQIAGQPDAAADIHTLNPNLIPGCIYTTPEIAIIGMSADDAKQAGIAAVAGIAKYSANGKALAEGESEGFVQLICEATTGELLGAQIVGAKAVELIAIVTPYLEQKRTVADIAHTVFAHPTLSEVVRLAAEVCVGKLKS